MIRKYQIWKNIFLLKNSKHNTLNPKIKEEKLVNESDISRIINNSALDDKIKTSARKAELKADKIKY